MTYAGTYGRDDRITVDGLLRREGHPLGVRREELGNRRDEVTALAAAEAEEAATSSKKWTFGVAAGALLMAGTFAAGALGITGGAAPLTTAAPEHAPAAPGHVPNGGPAVGAPGQDNKQKAPEQQQDPRLQQTAPSSAAPKGGVTSDRDLSSPTGNGERSGGGSGGSGGDTSTPPATQTPPPVSQQPAPPQQQQGPLGQVLTPVVDTADDILSPVTDPVTDIVGGLLGTKSADTSSQRTATPSGPALTMINPLGDLLGG